MCPKCKAPIEYVDQNFCIRCGYDLRPHQDKCGACGDGVHAGVLAVGERHRKIALTV